jgi:hypothetical protein
MSAFKRQVDSSGGVSVLHSCPLDVMHLSDASAMQSFGALVGLSVIGALDTGLAEMGVRAGVDVTGCAV